MRIRNVTTDDAAAIADIYRPFVEATVVTFDETAPDTAEFAARITSNSGTYPWLIADDNGKVAGYAYASQYRSRLAYRWSVDVAIYLHEDFRGQGLGRQLYSALFDELRHLGFYNAYAGITIPNPASLGLHKAMGFEPIGIYKNVGYKLGRWLDVQWLSLQLQDPKNQPSDPLPAGGNDSPA